MNPDSSQPFLWYLQSGLNLAALYRAFQVTSDWWEWLQHMLRVVELKYRWHAGHILLSIGRILFLWQSENITLKISEVSSFSNLWIISEWENSNVCILNYKYFFLYYILCVWKKPCTVSRKVVKYSGNISFNLPHFLLFNPSGYFSGASCLNHSVIHSGKACCASTLCPALC